MEWEWEVSVQKQHFDNFEAVKVRELTLGTYTFSKRVLSSPQWHWSLILQCIYSYHKLYMYTFGCIGTIYRKVNIKKRTQMLQT
jgi:hypothetical protein